MINEQEASAYNELKIELRKGEEIEAIVFNNLDDCRNMEDFHLPKEYCCRPLTLKEARPYLYGWVISGGFDEEEVIPIYVWTNKRVLFIRSYDGSTWLDSVPRNPVECNPYTIGGG